MIIMRRSAPSLALATRLANQMELIENPLIAPMAAQVRQRARAGLLTITPAEFLVLRQMMTGDKAQANADALGISQRTYEAHLVSLTRKTGCTRVLLMRCVFELKDDPELLKYLQHLPQKIVRGGAPRKEDRNSRKVKSSGPTRLVLPRAVNTAVRK